MTLTELERRVLASWADNDPPWGNHDLPSSMRVISQAVQRLKRKGAINRDGLVGEITDAGRAWLAQHDKEGRGR